MVLTNTSSIEAAYNSLLQEFDVDSVQLRKDLHDFVEKLLTRGLVELSIPEV